MYSYALSDSAPALLDFSIPRPALLCFIWLNLFVCWLGVVVFVFVLTPLLFWLIVFAVLSLVFVVFVYPL